MLYPQRLQQRAFGRVAGGGDDICPQIVGDLDCGHADATCASVDEDTLTFPDPRDIPQRMPGGHENYG